MSTSTAPRSPPLPPFPVTAGPDGVIGRNPKNVARQYPDSYRPWRRKTEAGRRVDKLHGEKGGVVGSVKSALLENGASGDGDGEAGVENDLEQMRAALVDARRKLLHPPKV